MHPLRRRVVRDGMVPTAKLTELGESGMLELLQQGRPNAPQPTGGVADLLSISQAEGQRALEDIERILEIAAQNGESIAPPRAGVCGWFQPPNASRARGGSRDEKVRRHARVDAMFRMNE